jgi:hypothetical protein
MNKLYSVVYRTGGTDDCTWIRVLESFQFENAKKEAEKIERMGYKTIIHDADHLKKIGLPVGWDHKGIDWENDIIIRDGYFWTQHIKDGKRILGAAMA